MGNLWVRSQTKRTQAMYKTSIETIPRNIMNSGRVISAANESKLIAARDQIDAVLSALKMDDESNAMNRGRNLSPGVLRIGKIEEKEAEVFIYGDIGDYWDGVSADEFVKEISILDVETINVRLNSCGGVIYHGIAIYNALVRHKAKVVVHIDGIAASIASVIAMAGDEIMISEGSNIMIHKPWSFTVGDANAMRKEGEVLDKLEAGIIDIIEARTGNNRAQLESWMAEETWFLGQEAVDAGFADMMIPAKKKEKPTKSSLLNLFKKTPKNLLPENDNVPSVREFERLLRDGEGLSNSQAKRVAALAFRTHRKDEPEHREDEHKDATHADFINNCMELKRIIDNAIKETTNA